MRILIFLFVVSFLPCKSQSLFHNLISQEGGQAWYISNSGNGSNDGHSPGSPLDPVSFLSETVLNGDRILFNKGETIPFGDYEITASSVTVDAYGTGDAPKLIGSEDISGLTWTSEGGGIYSTPMASEPDWIFINGRAAKNTQTARITILSRPSTTSITVNHSDVSAYNIVGSYLVLQRNEWSSSQRVVVTAYNGAGTITISPGIPELTLNIGLALYNNTEYFNTDNEWAWESDTLYVKAAASPSTMNIRQSVYDYAFKVTGGSSTIQNIEIQQFYQHGVWATDGIAHVKNCNIHDLRDTGIFYERSQTGIECTGNTIKNVANNGIFASASFNSKFNNNTIDSIGTGFNWGWPTWVTAGGIVRSTGFGILTTADLDNISIDGSGNEINYNIVRYCSYSGIGLTLINTEAKYNYVYKFGTRFTDGGGIYTTFKNSASLTGAEIAYNHVENDAIKTNVLGIYMDSRSFGVNVHHNVILNGFWGILFNRNTSDHTCEDNIIVNSVYGIVYAVSETGAPEHPTNINNINRRNIIAVHSSSQRCMQFDVSGSGFASWNPFSGTGESDSSIYINPYGVAIANSDNKGNNLTLSGLQTAYGEDANSSELTNFIVSPGYPEQNLKVISNYSASPVMGTAPDGYGDVYGNPLSGYTIPAYYGLLMVARNASDSSVQFTASSSQYLNLGTASDIEFEYTDPFSISMWFKMPAPIVGGSLLWSKRSSTNARNYSIYITDLGLIQFSLISVAGSNFLIRTTTVDKADNVWHHILYRKTTTATSGSIYVDGVLAAVTSGGTLSGTIVSTENVNLGRHPTGGTPGYLTGYLDEVAIWDSDQLSNLDKIYNGGLTHDMTLLPDPPLHYWKLGDNGYVDTGTSGTTLNGTAVNSPPTSSDVP